MAALVIGIAKPKASEHDDMGGDDAPESERQEKSGDSEADAVSGALDDAWDAYMSKNKDAWKEAMSAAIAAKCADMYAKDEDDKPKSDDKKEEY